MGSVAEQIIECHADEVDCAVFIPSLISRILTFNPKKPQISHNGNLHLPILWLHIPKIHHLHLH
jgi:hypothetical protein